MLFDKCRNTKQQGNIGLGKAIQYFTLSGYTVSLPLNDSQDYDLIVDNGTLYKVQVKTTKHKSKYGIYKVNLRVLGGNSKQNYVHKKGDEIVYDILFVVCDNDDIYLIPKNNIKQYKNSISLGEQYIKFKI